MKTLKTPTFVGAVIVCLALTSSILPAEEMKGHDPMTMQLKERSGAEFEKEYLQMMIEHHKGGVKMAQLVPQKTKRPELKELSGKIIAAQQEEIQKMTGWLKTWHQSEPNPAVEPEASKKMMQEHMAMLEKAEGDEFDKVFLEMMSMHHKGAMHMSRLVDEKTDRAELKEFAKKIDDDQSKEIKQMQEWRKAWFKDAAAKHDMG